MSPRTRTTFAKRQKEQARKEKQRAKAQRKLQRKLENQTRMPGEDGGTYPDAGVPTDVQLNAQLEPLLKPSIGNTESQEEQS